MKNISTYLWVYFLSRVNFKKKNLIFKKAVLLLHTYRFFLKLELNNIKFNVISFLLKSVFLSLFS